MDTISLAARLHSLTVADWTVVVAGISIVIGTLLLLIVVFYAFGAILQKTQKISGNKKAKKQAKNMKAEVDALSKPAGPPITSAPTPAAPAVEAGISGEVVAAISAAVYSMEGSGATIKSIARKKASPITSRNPWASAGVADNTRPF